MVCFACGSQLQGRSDENFGQDKAYSLSPTEIL